MSRYQPKHYCRPLSDEPHGPVQVERDLNGNAGYQLPQSILEQAYKEYAAQGHRGQSLERINQRGGFGILEVIALLSDRVGRLEHELEAGYQ